MNYIFACLISFVFIGIKYAYSHATKEEKPFKHLAVDTFFVFLSVLGGGFLYGQIMPLISEVKQMTAPQVFTDAPNF